MSRFEKVCWAWVRLNEYALRTVDSNPDARAFRFEDIFLSDERYDHLSELLNFVTELPNVHAINLETLEGWLEHRIHESSGDFPTWENWSSEQKQLFEDICGPLMKHLGYSD